MKELTNDYPGFEYTADQLGKFLLTAGIFTISLKGSDRIVNYSPDDTEGFLAWLTAHSIQNLKESF